MWHIAVILGSRVVISRVKIVRFNSYAENDAVPPPPREFQIIILKIELRARAHGISKCLPKCYINNAHRANKVTRLK